MRSAIGNSASDPLFVTEVNAAGVQAPAGTSADPISAVDRGAASIATAQVSVTTASTLIAALRAGRSNITIINLGTTAVFIGVTGVTTATGLLLAGVVGASITIPTSAAIYGIVASGTQSVSVLETF